MAGVDVALVTSRGGVELVVVRDSVDGLVDVWGRLVDPVSVLWVGDLAELGRESVSGVLCAA